MAPSKRTSARATVPNAKKAKMDPVTEKVQQVLDALKEDEECIMPQPAACRQGLLDAFPHAFGLGSASDERHSYHTTVADSIREILTATAVKWERRDGAAKAGHEASLAEKAARDAVLENAQGRLSAGHAAVEEAKAQVEADASAERTAEEALKEATAQVENFDDIQAAKATERDEYTSLLTDVFQFLKAGEWGSPEDQKKFERAHLEKLTTMLRKLKIDESLLSAMGPALKAKPAARGSFGDMTLSEVEGALKKHLEDLGGELDNGEATKALKQSAQGDAQLALEATKAKLAASQEALKSSEDKVAELKEEVAQAQKCCQDQEEVISEFEAKQYIDNFGLEKSQETLKAFDFLRDRVAKPVESMEAEDQTEPAIAGA